MARKFKKSKVSISLPLLFTSVQCIELMHYFLADFFIDRF